MCKWLDFLAFSDKDEKTVGPLSQHFHVSGSFETQKNPHPCWKRGGDVDAGGVANLSCVA